MFKKKSYLFIVLNNGFLAVDIETKEKVEIMCNFQVMPYTHFYYYMWEDKYAKDITGQIKEKLKISGATVYIAISEDSLEVDKRCISEAFKFAGARKVCLLPQNLSFNAKESKFITVSKTQKVYMLTYVKDFKEVVSKFFDVNKFTVEDISLEIRKLNQGCSMDDLPVYINCLNNRDEYINLGTPVFVDDLINNIEEQIKINIDGFINWS